MCWFGKNIRHIAKEDIKVQKIFKCVSNKITSPIFESEWERGMISPKVDIPVTSFPTNRFIHEGYHCCRQITIEFDCYCYPSGDILMKKKDSTIMLNCIIPKGTAYYEDDLGEIVCEQLMLI